MPKTIVINGYELMDTEMQYDKRRDEYIEVPLPSERLIHIDFDYVEKYIKLLDMQVDIETLENTMEVFGIHFNEDRSEGLLRFGFETEEEEIDYKTFHLKAISGRIGNNRIYECVPVGLD